MGVADETGLSRAINAGGANQAQNFKSAGARAFASRGWFKREDLKAIIAARAFHSGISRARICPSLSIRVLWRNALCFAGRRAEKAPLNAAMFSASGRGKMAL